MASTDITTPDRSPLNRYRNIATLVLIGGLLLTLSGCAKSISFAEAAIKEEVGFFHGLWHGFISPLTFFISLFDSDVAIYAIYNNGGWYDFGFVIGAGILFGGSQHT
jgi:hypothetical protein